MNTSMYNRFASRGNVQKNIPGKNGVVGERVVYDNRKPIYIIFILDKSSSMNGKTTVFDENGDAVSISKIEQLNEGIKKVMHSLKKFEDSNPLYRLYYLIIELDSFGKALDSQFVQVGRNENEIRFEANGCTDLKASLNTLKTFISDKYLRDDRPERQGGGYNKAVNVILMSDGWPTDTNGYTLSEKEYRNVIDDFNKYLKDMDYFRSVDKYAMAVGDDACEDMLRYFADGGEELGEDSRFYRVEACESIATALDYLTRASLAHHTYSPVSKVSIVSDTDDENDFDIDTEDDSAVSDTDDKAYVSDIDSDTDTSDGDSHTEQPDDASSDEIKYEIDIIACKKDKCMDCVSSCPYSAIEVHSGVLSINDDKCNGCGACKGVCPYGAIAEKEKLSDEQLDKIFNDID